MDARDAVLIDINIELGKQDVKWGQQNHPDGTGGEWLGDSFGSHANVFRDWNDANSTPTTWTTILLEEVFEALAETDPKELRKELIQVAAVCAQWVEHLDRREDD